jgi:hypothetical protein
MHVMLLRSIFLHNIMTRKRRETIGDGSHAETHMINSNNKKQKQ